MHAAIAHHANENDHKTVMGRSRTQIINSAMDAAFAPERFTASSTKNVQNVNKAAHINTNEAIAASRFGDAISQKNEDAKPVEKKKSTLFFITPRSDNSIQTTRLIPFQKRSTHAAICKGLLLKIRFIDKSTP